MSTVLGTWCWPAASRTPGEARRAVTEVAARLGVPAGVQAAIGLALSEAVTNAVVHAYRSGGAPAGPPEVAVELLRDEDRLQVVVRDHGAGLAPRPDSPGLGLGLSIIAELAHESDVRVPPGGGTEVAMAFRLGGAA